MRWVCHFDEVSVSSPQSVATRDLSNIFSLCPILKFPSSLTLSLQCASAAKANRFMNFRHIGNGTECASPPSLINPIPPDSTVFCLRGAIASTTSDFVFKFRSIALTKKQHSWYHHRFRLMAHRNFTDFLIPKGFRLRHHRISSDLWIMTLCIKIPCNRATSCNSSGKLKLPSSQPTLVRVGGIVQDLPSTWLVQEAWLCSRCAAELSIVNCELWIECVSCTQHIHHMHVRDLAHTCTARVSCTQFNINRKS